MAHLSLRLLGSFQVSLGSEAINSFRTDKAQALLAYLAMHAGTPCRRTSLAGTLWADYEESSARTNLRQALRRLRTAIRDVDASPPYLLTTRTTITLDPESDYWLDADAFSQALETVRAHAHRSVETCAACAERLGEAVALYRGEFLAGFSLDSAPFEEWMVVERERLVGQVLDALGHLAAYHEAQGAYHEAERYARRSLALEPWLEDAHRALMRALALDGQRSAALIQYETCRDVLCEELRVEPAEETTQLYERIRDGQDLSSFLKPDRSAPSNLPAQLTPFVGRETELAEITERLADPGCRLLTLVGPGGSGKTRLALEAASGQLDSYADGVFFVSLAPLGPVEAIVPTIAQAIGFTFSRGAAPKEQLLAYLRRKNVLLVLDNYEHLLEGAGLATEILRAAPKVRILATSRAGLHLRGEHRFPVPGMDLPPLLDPKDGPGAESRTGWSQRQGAEYSAVQLFLQSVRRVQPNFGLTDQILADVIRICRLVEGMPLGILLAAAWVQVFAPAEIAAEIARSLDFLESNLRDAPERQHSLRATFEHSWNLLGEREREAMASLSVFRGGFGREAAQQVAGSSPRELMALIDKSLLHRTPAGRYEVHELLRQYAEEKLAQSSGAEQAARDRHSAHYIRALERWGTEAKGPRQQAALAEIDADFENARAAWDWAVEQGQVERLDRAMEGLGLFYEWRGRYQEGASAFGILASPPAGEAPATATVEGLRIGVRALAWQGYLGLRLGHADRARTRLTRGLDLLDRPPLLDRDTRRERALLLWVSGWVATWSSDHREAARLYTQSLALYRALGDRWGTANALHQLGGTAHSLGGFDKAIQLQEETLSIRQELGDLSGIGRTLNLLGVAHRSQGHLREAERLLREAIALARDTGDQLSYAWTRMRLALTFVWEGEFVGGISMLEECQALFDDLGVTWGPSYVNGGLGFAKGMLGQYKAGRHHIEQGLTHARETGDKGWIGVCLVYQGILALAEGKHVEALRCLRESVTLHRARGQLDGLGQSLAVQAGAAAKLGQLAQARQHLCEAFRITVESRDAFTPMFALPAAALLLANLGQTLRAIEIYALASRYPFVANSRWFEDVYGQHIASAAAALPPQTVAAAEERGRARDLWATAEELLVELQEDRSEALKGPTGSCGRPDE